MTVTCEKCSKEFRDCGHLKRHLASKKPCDIKPEDKHRCSECDKQFKSDWHLRRHKELVHKNDEVAVTEAAIVNSGVNNGSILAGHHNTVIHNHITFNIPTEFGRESVEDLVKADWNKLGGVTNKREIVTALINFLNCNEDRPEGHNVLVKDDVSDEAYVYTQKNWRQRNCDEALRDCISNVSLKAQDALVDKDFNVKNPTPKARIDACLKTMEEIAEQADKADPSVAEDVERAKTAIVKFTSKHLDLLEHAQEAAVHAARPKKHKASKVLPSYAPAGLRRQQLLEALQKGDAIPELNLEDLQV